MTAMFSGLEGEAYDRQYEDRELVARIRDYFAPFRREVVIIVLCMMLQAGAAAALPLAIAAGISVIADGASVAIVPYMVALVIVFGVAIWGLNWIRRRLIAVVLEGTTLTIRTDAFAAAARQDMAFHDEFSSGRIVSRITSDTSEFSQVVDFSTDVVSQLATALILVGVLFTIEWRLTLATLVMTPVLVAFALSFRNQSRRVTRQSSRALGEVNKAIQEAVTGIAVAKNFHQEQAIYDDFHIVNHQVYGINVRRGVVLSLIFPVLNIIYAIAIAALLYLGGQSAATAVISISAWYLFMTTVDRFGFPIINVSAFWSQFQAGLAAIERVFALIDSKSTVVQQSQQPLPTLKGAIEFEHINFSYNNDEPVLSDFSLTIQPGETVAFVGHTGAGKSSIAKLLARFYEYQGGQIRVDGHDLRSVDLVAYRQQLGLVTQVPFLFDDTVAENIRYGQPATTDEAIVAMARSIGEGEWVDTLPEGLQTRVGERGSRLSMGQRQLVALMRVLVKKPAIFILDEATASIDPFTESQIQQALELIMRRSTAIIIAHRLSTVRAADRIIVLSQGAIIEAGNHESLLAAGGHYAELYNTYFRHQSLDYINERGWQKAAES